MSVAAVHPDPWTVDAVFALPGATGSTTPALTILRRWRVSGRLGRR